MTEKENDMIMLTNEERRRFAAYLIQEAEDFDAMARQAALLAGAGPEVGRLRTAAVAYFLVARQMGDAEEMTIGSGDGE